ncbi:MAG: hypothetical protein PHG08_00160 [Bacilli bacterium]|nr:hypothetical protein [Bacilli bacterium]
MFGSILTKLTGVVSGATPYIYAIVFAIGLALGGTAAYKIEHSKVLSMQLSIANQKIEAAKILAIETQKVAEAEKQTRLKNQELDKANEQSIATINAYHDKLAAALRLRDPNYKHSVNTLPTNTNTNVNSEDEKTSGIISAELARLLQSEALRADKITVDYNTLLEFVINNNCGIQLIIK